MFASPSQILYTVFGINIYYYGVIMAIAICAGALVSDWAGKKYFGLNKDLITDILPYLIFFGIAGARLYYCLLDYEFYMRFPTEILALRHGGISVHGAILGGAAGLWLYSVRRKLSAAKLCDVCALGLPLGQAIGRWGNFFNSEAYGSPSNLPWKLYIPPQYRTVPYLDNEYFHPAFLYESILDILIFLILLFLVKKNKIKQSGNLALIYLILYSAARIAVETLRVDSTCSILGIPVAIFVSACIIVVSVVFLFVRKRGRI